MGSNMVDEIDCSSFFDHIDDLIDFPQENENAAGLTSTDCKDFPSIWNDPLQDSDALFSASHRHSASDLSAELLVPYEDIVQLEWLSTFVEDSFSGEGLTLRKESVPLNKEPPSQGKFQTSSPVSVLESSSSSSSSSSCSVEKTFPLISPCQRARTKRPRPATFNPPAAIQLISPTSSFTEAPKPFIVPRVVPESENIAESPMKKKKKIKLTFPRALVVANDDAPAQPVRKCQHCEITKTPQWRAGPTGPKTLCNACGVRYKSGRLFPEYRPAASPTFVPSIHSNSHKKVVEMRSKFVPDNNATTTIVPVSATATKSEVKPIKKESVDEEYK